MTEQINLPNEIWKEFEDYKGYYGSSLGRFKNKTTLLKQTKFPSGIHVVKMINNNGKRRTLQSHRIIMILFKPIENHDKLVVNHINGIKHDNNIENLEWITQQKNVQHAYDNKLNKNAVSVQKINVDGSVIEEYSSIKNACVANNLTVFKIEQLIKTQKIINDMFFRKNQPVKINTPQINSIDTNTQWKKIIIDNNQTNYSASNVGIIRNDTTNRLLKPNIVCGYHQVTLYIKDKRKTCAINRLIAIAFLDNPKKLQEVNHKNKNKFDNNVNNLEWMSKSENISHASGKKINKIDENGNIIETYISIVDASKKNNMDPRSIVDLISGKIKKSTKCSSDISFSYAI